MTDLDDYIDLGERTGLYECQRCKHRFQEKFERHNCPNCDTPESVLAAKEWAKKVPPVDHNPGFTGYQERTVNL